MVARRRRQRLRSPSAAVATTSRSGLAADDRDQARRGPAPRRRPRPPGSSSGNTLDGAAGIRRADLKPSSAADVASNVPPSAVTRSRSPARPRPVPPYDEVWARPSLRHGHQQLLRRAGDDDPDRRGAACGAARWSGPPGRRGRHTGRPRGRGVRSCSVDVDPEPGRPRSLDQAGQVREPGVVRGSRPRRRTASSRPSSASASRLTATDRLERASRRVGVVGRSPTGRPRPGPRSG